MDDVVVDIRSVASKLRAIRAPGEITALSLRHHSKASESYVDVRYEYDAVTWNGSIPIVYRRTGVELLNANVISQYLVDVYAEIEPSRWPEWRTEQATFWDTMPRAATTRPFFEAMLSFNWTCAQCELPQNPNFARRIQALKDLGYTLATSTKKKCGGCYRQGTHHLLIPLPRGGLNVYETWSPALRKKIIAVLKSYDAFEAKRVSNALLPDHKFPEIRWNVQTARPSLENLSADDIQRDFQLLSNQRNQQKREVCRQCFQTGERGVAYGVPFFSAGDRFWPTNVPKTGKEAEAGCLGCAWYDLEAWRKRLLERLQ